MTPAASPFQDRINGLAARLASELPGAKGMAPMAAADRELVPVEEALRRGAQRAAALVLLYPDPVTDEAMVALTARSPDLRHHAGQVSFPGGRIDAGEDAQAASLREAWEELAVPATTLTVIGSLSPLYIPPSGFLVHPVVAWAEERPVFKANPSEVAELIEAPVEWFCGTAHRRVGWREIRGRRRRTPHFAVGPHQVWGATAMMLAELGAVWSEPGPASRTSACT